MPSLNALPHEPPPLPCSWSWTQWPSGPGLGCQGDEKFWDKKDPRKFLTISTKNRNSNESKKTVLKVLRNFFLVEILSLEFIGLRLFFLFKLVKPVSDGFNSFDTLTIDSKQKRFYWKVVDLMEGDGEVSKSLLISGCRDETDLLCLQLW